MMTPVDSFGVAGAAEVARSLADTAGPRNDGLASPSGTLQMVAWAFLEVAAFLVEW